MEEAQLAALERLLSLAERYGLAELRVEEDGLVVTIRNPPLVAAAPAGEAGTVTASAYYAPMLPVEESAAAAAPDTAHLLLAPMTGTWYRTPSPDDPPFASEGDAVEVGQTVGLIEAMKVFSDVPSDVAGTVLEFLIPSGKLVQQGDPILRIQPPE
jgi:acetyl-CoA carboxylase biotin carboxyl carrier protein